MDKRLLNALQCKNDGRPPIWIMRQAGRYMPEYRAVRSKYSFIEMCHTPELVAEVTQMPIRAFGMDAAILFSDILVIPEAFGVGLRFEDGVGPIIERPMNTTADVDALPSPNIAESLKYVSDSIKLLVPQLSVPLLGFCGAPFTVASYMIEGGSSKDMKKTKQWMLRNPESFHSLLKKIADSTIEYLKLQIASGVKAIQIFDSWAHFLGHGQFREFSLAYLKRIMDGVKDTHIPIILYCRGSSVFAQQLAELSPAAISLDWNGDISRIRREIPSSIALQGNLDPDILYADSKRIRMEAQAMLNTMKGQQGYIFNLGHGIHPDISVDAVRTLIDTVKTS